LFNWVFWKNNSNLDLGLLEAKENFHIQIRANWCLQKALALGVYLCSPLPFHSMAQNQGFELIYLTKRK
jgi:hypothetical protein